MNLIKTNDGGYVNPGLIRYFHITKPNDEKDAERWAVYADEILLQTFESRNEAERYLDILEKHLHYSL
ncbi:MAG: hypothetical protein K6G55_03530 [Selenomonadaceae bacterium]|nr:hypothetical protein [Selenomonadaceae bacterium]